MATDELDRPRRDRRPHPTAPRPRRLGLLVTPATILRGFDRGNVRQLEIVSRRLLAGLAAETPMLADAAVMAHLDIDSTQRRVYGHAKEGAGFGAAKVGATRCGGVGSTRVGVDTAASSDAGCGCCAWTARWPTPSPRPCATGSARAGRCDSARLLTC